MTTLYLDIETANAGAQVLAAKIEGWRPPSNYKHERSIEAARLKRLEVFTDRAALMNESPIICIGYAIDGGGPEMITGNPEAEILAGFARRLPSHVTELIGHNILGFDLPKLRSAYLRNNMPIPVPLTWSLARKFDIIDTMRVVCREFNCEDEHQRMMPLSNACALVGIEVPPETVKGKDIPALYKSGDMARIVGHCRQDVELTRQLYRKLANLPPAT